MNSSKFDQIVESFVTTDTRRTFVARLVAVSLTAAWLPLGLTTDTSAKRRRGNRRRKRRRRSRCPGFRRCGQRCCPEGQFCVEGTCVVGRGTCASGADQCREPFPACNGHEDCFCVQSAEGATRCGIETDDTRCGQCSRSEHCAQRYPDSPGAFCAIDHFGPAGNCHCQVGEGACILPCPTEET